MSGLVFLNGKYLPESESYLPVNDLAVLRGYGVFDYMRTHKGKPFLIDKHLKRFFNSAAQFELDMPYTENELKEIIDELVNRAFYTETGIRLVVTGGATSDGFTPGKPNFFAQANQINFPDENLYENGAALIVHEYMREFPQIKSLNYVTSVKLRHRMENLQAVDVLYHYKNEVFETSRSNFFIVKQGKVITPGENILSGITRDRLIQLCGKKFDVEERSLKYSELKEADEAFITGTTKKVMPIVRIEEQIIGNGWPGKVTRQLMQLFSEFENAYR